MKNFPNPAKTEPTEGSRLTAWEQSMFTCLVENVLEVKKEEILRPDDAIALRIGKEVLAAMKDKKGKFWTKRQNDDVYDFAIRFNLPPKQNEENPTKN